MARLVNALVVGFVGANLFVGMLAGMGVWAAIGLPNPGADASVSEQAVSQAESVSTGTGSGETLFGLYNVIGGWFSGLFGTIYPAMDLLVRAGAPEPIIHGLISPLITLTIGIGLAQIVRGI